MGCERFAVFAGSAEEPAQCVVCGRTPSSHELPGIRLLTDEEVQALGARLRSGPKLRRDLPRGATWSLERLSE